MQSSPNLHLDRNSIVNDVVLGIVLHPSQIDRVDLIILLAESSLDAVLELSHHFLPIGFFDVIVFCLSNYGCDVLLETRIEEYRATEST